MASDIYKVLFEVLFLHEYYLTDSNQSSVFDDANIADPGPYLQVCMQQGRPSVGGLLQFALPAATQQFFDNQQMRLVNSYSGFQVAVKVTASKQADGSVLYTPAISLPPGSNLLFLLQASGSGLDPITNGRRQREVKSLYYFCNESLSGTKTFPVLSNPIPPLVAAGAYEQGELVNDNNTIKAFYFDGQDPQYLQLSGDGFVNESDRVLVSPRFDYLFHGSDSVTEASFTLKNSAGVLLRTIQLTATDPLGSVSLDFSRDAQGNVLPLVTLPAAALSDPLTYTLTVSGSGNYSRTMTLVFYDDPSALAASWGLIQLQATVGDNNYSLLDTAGNLLTRQLADGTVQGPRSFQIRCKSLFTFLRYVNDQGLALSAPAGSVKSFLQQVASLQSPAAAWQPAGSKASATAAKHVAGSPKPAAKPAGKTAGKPAAGSVKSVANAGAAQAPLTELTTTTPIPLTYLPYFFSNNPKAASPAFVYLPNAVAGGETALKNQQFFSVIRVPKSKLFPSS